MRDSMAKRVSLFNQSIIYSLISPINIKADNIYVMYSFSSWIICWIVYCMGISAGKTCVQNMRSHGKLMFLPDRKSTGNNLIKSTSA